MSAHTDLIDRSGNAEIELQRTKIRVGVRLTYDGAECEPYDPTRRGGVVRFTLAAGTSRCRRSQRTSDTN